MREELDMPSKDQIDKAWNNAKKIRGKDPDQYRQDPYGNPMYKPSYGKDSEIGWEIDHIKPMSRGGSDSTRNLQALNTKVNRNKGDSVVKKSRHSKSNK
jgi:5-methylcytosine-specific restriction endonuclease McrA